MKVVVVVVLEVMVVEEEVMEAIVVDFDDWNWVKTMKICQNKENSENFCILNHTSKIQRRYMYFNTKYLNSQTYYTTKKTMLDFYIMGANQPQSTIIDQSDLNW